MKGLVQLRSLRDGSQFGAWIVRIAKNTCINLIRKKKVVERHVHASSHYTEGQSAAHGIDVERALATLPEDLRLPLVLFYYDGRDVKHVAKQLDISASRVYQKLRLALSQLHEVLVDSGDIA